MSQDRPFVHLHLHTKFSMLDGCCHLGPLMAAAKQHHMPAVAMTDHGVMYGAVDFYKEAMASGIKPILGCEIYVAEGSRLSRNKNESMHHLVLLAESNEGYQNLVRLVSLAHLEGYYYKPRIDKELLAAHHTGLIGLSACLKGEVAALLNDGNTAAAVRAAGSYADILGKGNFFLEIMDHGMPDQKAVAPRLVEVARRTRIPLVATNDVHYLQADHYPAHEVLLCLQTQTTMSDPKRMRYGSDQFYFKTRAEMEAVFGELPDALDRTVDIADRCGVEFDFKARHFPIFDVPPGFSQETYLRKLVADGLQRHYGIRDMDHPADERERKLVERADYELRVIHTTDYINYFLVVWDFVRFARENGIPVGPGRGSGGGSIVAYALGIIAIDPIRYELIFERFLNPERVSPPDFDIDFCQTRRGEVIDYVKRRYGAENVAQIITFGSLGAKTVIRDIGRVLGISYGDCDRLAKMIPEDPKITLTKALEQNPEFKAAADHDPICKQILQHAFVLEGLYRNPGTHAAGVVIGEKPLIEIVPLALDKEEHPITQFTKEPVGEIGLLKMDFLGLKTLTVMVEAVELIRQTTGTTVDLESLPLDDRASYALLSRGDTVGVFQLESVGMQRLAREVGINNIEDLIAMIALYRPGPMQMLPDYVDRKTGKKPIAYDHPLLKPILENTYGVMVYQEQVQMAANVLGGYSLGQADLLRRAMSKKKPEEMEKHRAKFVEGCARLHQIGAETAGRIFDNIAQFAGYGFNKAHSTGYGIISYQTAWLKANHPAEFMAALLSSEIGNAEKLLVFINEARRMGLDIQPPNVNSSAPRFRPEGKTIHFGMAGIKNVGEGAAEAIVAERQRGGPFKGLIDFCSRVDGQLCNKKVLEALILAGAFDWSGLHRARLFKGAEFAINRAAEAQRDKLSGQISLFDMGGGGNDNDDSALPAVRPWHASEILAHEKELLGLYISGHPLTQHANLLQIYQLCSMAEFRELPDRTLTRIGGLAAQIHQKITKAKGDKMAVVNLETLEGTVEVVLFPDTYRDFGHLLQPDAPLMCCGETSRRDDKTNLVALEVYPLAQVPAFFTTRILVEIPTVRVKNGTMENVRQIFRKYPGTIPVVLCMLYPSGEKVFIQTESAFSVAYSDELVRELSAILGENSVVVTPNPTPCLKAKPRRRWDGGPDGR